MNGKKMDDSTLKIGIDLGTSRSAIASSDEHREWVESYVGWRFPGRCRSSVIVA